MKEDGVLDGGEYISEVVEELYFSDTMSQLQLLLDLGVDGDNFEDEGEDVGMEIDEDEDQGNFIKC